MDFFLQVQEEARSSLCDGANTKPHYSLRTLCRALQFTGDVVGQFGFPRALYEGMCMAFLSQLDRPSLSIMTGLIQKHFAKGMSKKVLSKYVSLSLSPSSVTSSHSLHETDSRQGTSATRRQLRSVR